MMLAFLVSCSRSNANRQEMLREPHLGDNLGQAMLRKYLRKLLLDPDEFMHLPLDEGRRRQSHQGEIDRRKPHNNQLTREKGALPHAFLQISR
jgi:hypothetical protein